MDSNKHDHSALVNFLVYSFSAFINAWLCMLIAAALSRFAWDGLAYMLIFAVVAILTFFGLTLFSARRY